MTNKQLLEKYKHDLDRYTSACDIVIGLTLSLGTLLFFLVLIHFVRRSDATFKICMLLLALLIAAVDLTDKRIAQFLKIDTLGTLFRYNDVYFTNSWNISKESIFNSEYVDLSMHRAEFDITNTYYLEVNYRKLKITKSNYEELLKAKEAKNKVYLMLTKEQVESLYAKDKSLNTITIA